MKRMAGRVPLALLLGGAACAPSGESWDTWWDSYDTGGYDGPFQISLVDFSCTAGTPDLWWFFVETDGLASLVTLDIYETGDANWPDTPTAVWDEYHELENVDSDGEAHTWDRWERTLETVYTIGDTVSGRTTLFDCSRNDGRSLAFMATMWGGSTPPVALDCAIWGYDSVAYFNNYAGNSCICFESNGCTD